jgi:hypothetical protein
MPHRKVIALIKRGTQQDWRIHLEHLLLADALVVGAVYAFGPERLQRSGTFAVLRETVPGGMDSVGWVAIIISALLASGLLMRDGRVLRIGHALGAGTYFLYALFVGVTLLPGIGTADAGAGWMHLFIISWIHFRMGIASPPLRQTR